MFFETKSNGAMRGEIAVAESRDNGVTWDYIGIALKEPWHLSFPCIFQYDGRVYMVPESSASGKVSLYSALDMPLQWKREVDILDIPLVDASILEWEGHWYLFGSPVSHSFPYLS